MKGLTDFLSQSKEVSELQHRQEEQQKSSHKRQNIKPIPSIKQFIQART
jgi:hypothetical protein